MLKGKGLQKDTNTRGRDHTGPSYKPSTTQNLSDFQGCLNSPSPKTVQGDVPMAQVSPEDGETH